MCSFMWIERLKILGSHLPPLYLQIPDDWHKGTIIWTWKGKDNHLDCSNYRGISLLLIPRRKFMRILLNWAVPYNRKISYPKQTRFRPSHSTIDQISPLRLMLEKVREYRENHHLYIAFVNLKATFDSLDHTALWYLLRSTGMSERIITLFSRICDSAESNVVSSSRQSVWFPVMIGVRQGCVAAPDLSCICDNVQGVWLCNYHLTTLSMQMTPSYMQSNL